jgi:redox-sensitive bicupin YhaK (pirin superfamily)
MLNIHSRSDALAAELAPRRIINRTRGHGDGFITRLMSPSDLGRLLKPFVFLDLFDADMRQMGRSMPLHPHSGIATITVFVKGEVHFDDPASGQGTIAYGGVEWLRAGGGVWHGKELSPGASSRGQGFQLWVALPPELENGPSESQYIEAAAMKRTGPAHVIVGTYQGVASPVRAPAGFNYLLVTLKSGDTWTYQPPQGHSIAWLAIAQGALDAGEAISAGEMAIFERGEAPIRLSARGEADTMFVLGSAVPHPHDLHLGYYSVHTSADALARGEQRIAELGRKLSAAGDRRTKSGSTPVFR